jgi:Flp pilus assembly protein TadD
MEAWYEWAHLILGQAHEQKGEDILAISELRKAVAFSHNSSLMVSALAHAYTVSGNGPKLRSCWGNS